MVGIVVVPGEAPPRRFVARPALAPAGEPGGAAARPVERGLLAGNHRGPAGRRAHRPGCPVGVRASRRSAGAGWRHPRNDTVPPGGAR
jgi:ribosome modulation factor